MAPEARNERAEIESGRRLTAGIAAAAARRRRVMSWDRT